MSVQVTTEVDYLCSIQTALSEKPLTLGHIADAQQIFDKATKDGVWQEQDPAQLFGTSFATWEQSTMDYKGIAKSLIDSARMWLQRQQEPPVPFEPLVFTKVTVPPSPKRIKT